MNLSLTFHKQIWIFLASLLFVSLVPGFIFLYLCVLTYLLFAFLILCLVDLTRKTSYRKTMGRVLEPALLALIVSLLIFYFTLL